jgi:hypothetical protein
MSISLKCQYAKTQGLAGIMIWELSQDVIGQRQPLLDAISTQVLTSVESNQQSPNASAAMLMLYDNYPNPFNPATTIWYKMRTSGFVTLRVYDLFGREIETLANEFKNAGVWIVRFDASRHNLSSGVYFYRLDAGGLAQTKRFIFMK